MRLRADRVEATAPASVLNIGAGDGAFALALNQMQDRISLRATAGTTRVIVEGTGRNVDPRDDTHPVIRGLRRGLDTVGAPQVGVYLHLVSQIPRNAGLGHLSANLLLGLRAAAAFVGPESGLTPEVQRQIAVKMGANPLRLPVVCGGGAALSYSEGESVSLRPPPLIAPVTFVPDFPAPVQAPAAPFTVDSSAVNAQAARAGVLALLLGGVEVADSTEGFLDLLQLATSPSVRAPLLAEQVPASVALCDWLRERNVPAFITGEGPAVVSLAAVSENLQSSGRRSGWAVTEHRVDQSGLQIHSVS